MVFSTRKGKEGTMDVEEKTKREWRVGWKHLDKAKEDPHWMPFHYESHEEAARVAAGLNVSEPMCNFFVSLVPLKSE